MNEIRINKKDDSNLAVVTLSGLQMKHALEGRLKSVDLKWRVTCCEFKTL